jgi:hypothetical protein
LKYENANEIGAETQLFQWKSEFVRIFSNYQPHFPNNFIASLYGDEIAKTLRLEYMDACKTFASEWFSSPGEERINFT